MRPLGDRALLVRGLAASRWKRAEQFAQALERTKPTYVVEIVAAFDSIAVHYDPLAMSAQENALDLLARWVLDQFETQRAAKYVGKQRRIEIPVHYGAADGPDLEAVAQTLALTSVDIIRLHQGSTYRVLAVGFLPGFAYLGGLPKELKLPRRASPRTRVPAGSVGLGGPYTGVYPCDSPGGWHLIGRTSLRLFAPDSSEGALLRVGDEVRFVEEAH